MIIGQQIYYNSLFPEMFIDLGHIGSEHSNFNHMNVKEYEKNSSEPKKIQKIISKSQKQTGYGNLKIGSIFNKKDKAKLIIQGKVEISAISENEADPIFLLNQFTIQDYLKVKVSLDKYRNETLSCVYKHSAKTYFQS